jgi:hypothetical protein
MTPARSHTTIQLNLPLLQGRSWVLPDDKAVELVQALVELLIGAAPVGAARGGDNESEADH